MLPYENLLAPPAAPAPALLDGVTVLDLTTSIAGPYAAMLLGDMGARDSVITVYQAFDTRDKPLTLGLGYDAQTVARLHVQKLI